MLENKSEKTQVPVFKYITLYTEEKNVLEFT